MNHSLSCPNPHYRENVCLRVCNTPSTRAGFVSVWFHGWVSVLQHHTSICDSSPVILLRRLTIDRNVHKMNPGRYSKTALGSWLFHMHIKISSPIPVEILIRITSVFEGSIPNFSLFRITFAGGFW